MGVDTKAIIRKDVSLDELVKFIANNYDNTEVHSTDMNYMFQISFKDGDDKRLMFCFFNEYGLSDYGINGNLLSFGCYGNSVSIMKNILNEFGGYILENDCEDDWYPINIDAFESSKTVTPLDVFRNKVVSKLGYNNLEVAMLLCKEYKEIDL